MPNEPASGAAPARPIVFLNPETVRHLDRAGLVAESRAAIGVAGQRSFRDEPVDALNALCEAAGALLVGTAPIPGIADVRGFLVGIGVRAEFGPEWLAGTLATDRKGAIAQWCERHGSPLCVVIDRPGAAPSRAIRINVPEGHSLTRAAADQALALLGLSND